MTDTLKPCPFCGAAPVMVDGGPGCFFVHCTECKVSGDDGTEERARDVWNRRAALRPIEPKAEVEPAAWMPIATAPKTGEEFIARTGPEWGAFSCSWDGDAFVHYDKDDGFIYYSPTEWLPMPAAGSASPSIVAPVGVKPLEWLGDFAHTGLGMMYHLDEPGTDRCVILEKIAGPATTKSFHYDRDAAKAAAQADYERRIRSALSTPADIEPVAWPIATDDQVEALARECGWDNRKYMTQKDYSIWCERMRTFARLAVPSPPDWAIEQIDRLTKALEPFSTLQIPKKAQYNAGAYSIRHSDIEAARAALSSTKSGEVER